MVSRKHTWWRWPAVRPKGRNRWSLRLLADKLVELEIVDDISYETVSCTTRSRVAEYLFYDLCVNRGIRRGCIPP
jgi:hypothetical protein